MVSLGVRYGRVERNTFRHRCRDRMNLDFSRQAHLALRCVSAIRSENNKYSLSVGEEGKGRKIETRYI